ncbi:hypothetical protein CGMCC3_g10130 [Colletotrichum fructicola]|nr:uncharacterized protein CGMCC3_g10130 [Colletotrichum fructicola]KAE9573865.1 hypothetical protein CGMCC3_g10130 [Colletotrichum fructicola]
MDLGGEGAARTDQWRAERCNGSALNGTWAEIWRLERETFGSETAERTPATLFPQQNQQKGPQ